MEPTTTIKPRVSVLMLTYNFSQYIDEAIASVMGQQCSFDFELVIGDDASTDGTASLCQQWAERYRGKIILLTNEHNTGLLANFARTYAHCRGEYIAICEGDDYWTDRSKLRRQVEFLDTHPEYSMCVHRVVNYYEGEGSMSLSNGGQKHDNDIIDLARSNFITNVSAMFRHSNIPTLPAWIADVATYDYALHMLNAEHGKIWYMPRCMAVYRKRSNALWSRAGQEKQYRMAMKVRLTLMRHFDGRRDDVAALLRKTYLDNAVALMRHYLATGEHGKSHALATEAAIAADCDAQALEATAATPLPPLSMRQHVLNLLKWCRRQATRALPRPRFQQ